MTHWQELLSAARLLDSLGPVAQLGLMAMGFAVLFLGNHLFRPAAGLVGALAFWLVAHTAMAQSILPPEAQTRLALGAMSAGFYTFGLMLPLSAVLMASGLLGVEAGVRLSAVTGIDTQLCVVLVSLAFVLAAGALHARMRSLIPALVGAGWVAFAGFVFVGGLSSAPEGARVPHVWFSVWITLTLLGHGWDILREGLENKARIRRERREEEKARERRLEEERKRYARYMTQ